MNRFIEKAGEMARLGLRAGVVVVAATGFACLPAAAAPAVAGGVPIFTGGPTTNWAGPTAA